MFLLKMCYSVLDCYCQQVVSTQTNTTRHLMNLYSVTANSTLMQMIQQSHTTRWKHMGKCQCAEYIDK